MRFVYILWCFQFMVFISCGLQANKSLNHLESRQQYDKTRLNLELKELKTDCQNTDGSGSLIAMLVREVEDTRKFKQKILQALKEEKMWIRDELTACSNFPVIKHGEINVEVKCQPGYYVDGDPSFLCQGAGQLTVVPRCMKAIDCLDVLKLNPFANSGVYDVIISENQQLISVYCDMKTEGGGWTVFQRRFNGSVDFYRNFKEYETGFGNIHGEFWLGLKKVQEMLYPGTSEVRIDVVTSEDRAEYIKYSDFQLLKGDLYELALDKTSLSGTVPDVSFGKLAGKIFSTKDRDYDSLPNRNCAESYHGAWWYYECTRVNLNGFYEVPGTVSALDAGNGGMIYRDVDGHKSLKETKMMFRRT